MYGAMLKFKSLPKIGFAHHFYMEKYQQTYGKESPTSLELVYVKKGSVRMHLYGKEFIIKPGSVLVLFRHLPIRLIAVDEAPQMHCTVQLFVEYDCLPFLSTDEVPINFEGLVLPMILEPSPEAEKIGKELNRIVSQIGMDRNIYEFSSSLCAMGILSELDRIYRKRFYKERKDASIIVYKIKKHLQENIERKVSLEELSAILKKTPNHLNAVFTKHEGISICHYHSRQKAERIAELIQNESISFKTACKNVGIYDISYGYRFFKNQMGMTPTEYLHGNKYVTPKKDNHNFEKRKIDY